MALNKITFFSSLCTLYCIEVWPPRFQSLRIMGWCSSKPDHRLWLPLDSIPMFKILCFPSEMILVPSFPPPEIRPGALLSRTSCPSPLSFRPFPLLSVHKCVFSRPPPVSGPPHRPSAGELPTLRLRPTNVLFWFLDPASHMQACTPPPRPIRLVVLGLGVGVCGGAKEKAPPAVVLSPSSRRKASPDRRPSACLRPTLDFPLDSCGPQ